MAKDKVIYKARMSEADAHYGGGLVDGARIMQLFGEAATELLIRLDGDEGLFRAYETVDFLAPVYAGDFIEVEASLLKQGNTSRKIAFSAFKIIEGSKDPKNPTRAKLLGQPLLVAKAVGTCVVKK